MTRPLSLLFALLLLVLSPRPSCGVGPEPVVTLLASTTTPYVGEQLVLTLEIRYRGRLAARPVVRWPTLDDFVAEEMPSLPPRRQVGGTTLVENARRAICPLTAGPLRLQGAGIMLGDRFYPAPPLTLRIRPLPLSGRPQDFSGAVGHLSMAMRTGDPGDRDVTLILEGEAPLASLTPPEARLPAGARLTPLGDRITGLPGETRRRLFRFRYQPAPGDAALPAFSLVVFDPASRRYRRLEIPEEAPPFGQLAFISGVALTGLLVLWSRSRKDLAPSCFEGCLADLLGRSPQGLNRRQILAGLRAAKLPKGAEQEIVRLWRAEDAARFAPTGVSPRPQPPPDRRRIVSLLRKAVDK